jgi:hypothetical protein
MTLGSTRWAVGLYPFEETITSYQGPKLNLFLSIGNPIHIYPPGTLFPYDHPGDPYLAIVQLHITSRLMSGPATLVEVWTANQSVHDDFIGAFTVNTSNWSTVAAMPQTITIGKIVPNGAGMYSVWAKILGSGLIQLANLYIREIGYLGEVS